MVKNDDGVLTLKTLSSSAEEEHERKPRHLNTGKRGFTPKVAIQLDERFQYVRRHTSRQLLRQMIIDALRSYISTLVTRVFMTRTDRR